MFVEWIARNLCLKKLVIYFTTELCVLTWRVSVC